MMATSILIRRQGGREIMREMKPEWFAGRLRELREMRGLDRQQLADRAGMTEAGVSNLEQGRRRPSWESVLALCAALDIEPSEFAKQPAVEKLPGRGRPRKAPDAAPPADEADAPPEPPGGKRRPKKGK